MIMRVRIVAGLVVMFAACTAVTSSVLVSAQAGPHRTPRTHRVLDVGPGPIGIGIRYETPSIPPVVAQASAVQAAEARLGAPLVSQATQVNVAYVLFSGESLVRMDAQGRLYHPFQRIPAWVVNFTGVNYAVHAGGRNTAGVAAPRYNHEVNIVIHAQTAEDLELFSYR